MTQEEKAKAYDEALTIAKRIISKNCSEVEKLCLKSIFPELAESEDEKMINELQGFLDSFGADYFGTGEWQKFHDWLEKQKESLHISETCKENPNSFTNEDERIRKFLVDYAIEMIAGLESDISLSTYDGIKGHDPEAEAELAQWQKARAYLEKQKEPHYTKRNALFDKCVENCDPEIMQRVSDEVDEMLQKEQKPAGWSEEHIACIFEKVGLAKIVREQGNDDLTNAVQSAMLELSKVENTEWSEEDRKMLDDCIMALSNWRDAVANYGHEVVPCQKLIDWLKSLRPHWKPSAQELGALKTAVSVLTEERTFPKAAAQIQKIIDVFDGKELRKDWKPSEEQMEALNVLNLHGDLSYVGQQNQLISLYQDLEKLM